MRGSASGRKAATPRSIPDAATIVPVVVTGSQRRRPRKSSNRQVSQNIWRSRAVLSRAGNVGRKEGPSAAAAGRQSIRAPCISVRLWPFRRLFPGGSARSRLRALASTAHTRFSQRSCYAKQPKTPEKRAFCHERRRTGRRRLVGLLWAAGRVRVSASGLYPPKTQQNRPNLLP